MNSTRAAAYYRVSTDRQAEADRHSLEAQRAAFTRHCAAREHEAVAEYQDVESGRKVSREAYQQMLADARAGRFDVIVVTFLDRFGRDQWEIMARLGELRSIGVEVEAVYEDTREFVMVALSAWKADQESKRNGERVRQASALAVQKGHPLGQYAYGYRRFRNEDGFGMVIDEAAAEVVRSIFRWYVTDALSMGAIRTRLNASGVPAPSGRTWSPEGIHRILRRRTYLGEFTYGGTTVPGMIPAIIDQATFDAAERRRTARATMKAPRAIASAYLLSGLLYCGHCGGRMEGHRNHQAGKAYRFYACANHRKRQACEYRNFHVADALEARVITDLAAAFQTPIESKDDEREQLQRELNAVERRLGAIPGRFRHYLALHEQGALSVSTLALHNGDLEAELLKLTSTREQLRQMLDLMEDGAARREWRDAVGETFAADFPTLTLAQQKAALAELVERITCLSHDPDPVITLARYDSYHLGARAFSSIRNHQ